VGGVEAVLEKEESPCWKRFVKQVGVRRVRELWMTTAVNPQLENLICAGKGKSEIDWSDDDLRGWLPRRGDTCQFASTDQLGLYVTRMRQIGNRASKSGTTEQASAARRLDR